MEIESKKLDQLLDKFNDIKEDISKLQTQAINLEDALGVSNKRLDTVESWLKDHEARHINLESKERWIFNGKTGEDLLIFENDWGRHVFMNTANARSLISKEFTSKNDYQNVRLDCEGNRISPQLESFILSSPEIKKATGIDFKDKSIEVLDDKDARDKALFLKALEDAGGQVVEDDFKKRLDFPDHLYYHIKDELHKVGEITQSNRKGKIFLNKTGGVE